MCHGKSSFTKMCNTGQRRPSRSDSNKNLAQRGLEGAGQIWRGGSVDVSDFIAQYFIDAGKSPTKVKDLFSGVTCRRGQKPF